MTMHHARIIGNKISGDDKFTITDLPETKTEFIFPEAATYEPSVADELTHKEQSDLHNQQNKLTIALLEKALEHVRKYDSMETASQIVAKAFHKCPSMFNKKLIVEVNRSLKAAIKADKWARSRRRKRHVDESTVRRNIDTFYEKLAEAVASVRLDLDKRSLTLFSKIKKQYESSLPLTLPNDKKFVKNKAHIVAMCESKPSAAYKFTRLEGNLFLIENAVVLGINRTLYKSTMQKASEIATKLGRTIYHNAVSRPSDNIDWYVIQDFGVELKFVSFADKLDVTDNPVGDNLSYEGFIKRQADEAKAEQQLKSKRLAEIRQSFHDDNIALFDDLRKLKVDVDNLLFERAILGTEFHAITNVTGEYSGIDISQIRRLYDKSMEYRNFLQHEGMTFKQANTLSFRQRVEAKSVYYDYMDMSAKLREVRGRISFLEEEIETRKVLYARKLGMVSPTKYAEVDY